MSDLFKKFNTLIKAKLNDVIPDMSSDLSKMRLPGQKVDRDIAMLRERINDAITYEEDLQKRVQALQAEVDRLDQAADEAVKQGNDASARHYVEQMQRAQQRLNMAQSDLQAHQLVAQELIQKVNMLEAAVADAKRENQSQQPTDDQAASVNTLNTIITEAKDRITKTKDGMASRLEDQTETDNQAVDDDLSARRQRLSK